MDTTTHYPSTFEGLLQLAAHLRGPDGCPWDREQTRESMRRYILEECYELLGALDDGDARSVNDELGDVLFHMAFQIQLGKEAVEASEEQVFKAVIEKLTRRHPHVFGDATVSDARQVESNWNALKRREKTEEKASVVDGVPEQLPALANAQAIQERAARAGFDWEDVPGVLEKVAEELEELSRSRTLKDTEAELGDLLFSIVNVSRWIGTDAESALRRANVRFRTRFALMETLSRDRGVSFEALSLVEKEALWEEAKSQMG